MIKYFLALCFCLLYFLSFSQLRMVDFNEAIPSNFSTNGNSNLSLSNEHTKNGANALAWKVEAGTSLIVDNLAIPSSEIASTQAGSAQFFIYSKNITTDTLVFQFFDKAGNLKREGHLLLNFKGWRDYHRSYRFDYNFGNELPAFDLNKIKMSYHPTNPSARTTLYLDEFKIIGDTKKRYPGPHLKLDAVHFYSYHSSDGGPLKISSYSQDPVTPATPSELEGLKKVKKNYERSVRTVSEANLTKAIDYVASCNIHRNSDNSITGKGIQLLDNTDTLIKLSSYCGYLAEAAIHNRNTKAKEQLLLFVEYLLDQGLAEGGRNISVISNYGFVRTFPIGFLEALPLLTDSLHSEVMQMLKWSNYYNIIYNSGSTAGVLTDFIYLVPKFIFELAFLESDKNIQVRDLKCISRFLSNWTTPTLGSTDGIKPDGMGFHHWTSYPGYMYAFNVFADEAFTLKGTPFRITQTAYTNMSNAFRAQLLSSSRGTIIANSYSGRHPFSKLAISEESIRKFIEVGGDIIHKPFEPELASLYNYVYGNRQYPVEAAKMDGFYQFNYAQAGILRKDNWVAVMKGFTNRLWGTEIYSDANRYGRYQSYGALEILYDGNWDASGYVAGGAGWDWNIMPGTTTVHLPYPSLQANKERGDERQTYSFVGALAYGNNGIFAMDFKERAEGNYTPSNLTFKKSVFAFGNMMICLGSGISSSNTKFNTATNLFQSINVSDNPSIYTKSNEPVSDGNYNNILSTSSSYQWLVNGQSTGYYIPKNAGEITVLRGTQTTPISTTTSGFPVANANFSKAFINHGTSPKNGQYQFVVVPATTPKKMEQISASFANGEVFEVLKQTDTLHAVYYIPNKITSYAFFEPMERVNIGYVNSISEKALVAIKEQHDSITITIDNPDLNAGDAESPKDAPIDAVKGWKSIPINVVLKLKGNWLILNNPSKAGITVEDNTLSVKFTLVDGLQETITLKKK